MAMQSRHFGFFSDIQVGISSQLLFMKVKGDTVTFGDTISNQRPTYSSYFKNMKYLDFCSTWQASLAQPFSFLCACPENFPCQLPHMNHLQDICHTYHQQNICHILCALNQCKCTIPVEPLEGTSTFRMLAQIDLPRGFGFVAIGVPIQGHFVVFALQKVLVLLTVMPKQLVVDYPFLLSCPRVSEITVG